MPSNFDEKNAIEFWGQYPGNFETKFFPLRFEGILYNSVSGHNFLALKFIFDIANVVEYLKNTAAFSTLYILF